MSDIIDRGSWTFAAVAVLVVSGAFYASVNVRLEQTYRVRGFEEFYQPRSDDSHEDAASLESAQAAFDAESANRPRLPIVGDRFFTFFSFDPTKFYYPLLLISIFYVPVAILLMCVFSDIGSFGLVLRRDYGTLAVCALNAWAAGHLPFAALGFALTFVNAAPQVFLGLWLASGLAFGVFMIFALRTVLGAHYGVAGIVVGTAWVSFGLGGVVLAHVSPLLFSPFLLFWLFIYFGGYLGGEVRGFGNARRRKQNLKRFLHNATVNPRDADAHVQLGLIYLQRRQDALAIEHLEKAIEIDRDEIDAHYELGKIARLRNELQKALDHFAVVVEKDDKYALSEIWREIGATYLDAGMYKESRDALEKFTERRSANVEGLYYLGRVLKAQGENDKAREIFEEAITSAKASPDYKRGGTRQWQKLAEKELKS